MATATSPATAISSGILNLGCGRKRVDGAVNVDRTPDTNPDVVHNLDQTPWPFADNTFREVLANDVVEHLGDLLSVMEEIHRVCASGAVIRITVPHFSSPNTFTDPTHRHAFGVFSFDYFTEASELSFYTRVRFRRREARITFEPGMVSKILWRLANRYPAAYERRWAWIFPAWFLYFELEVVK